jgi:tetratricopeptide (TPR) repeat protein
VGKIIKFYKYSNLMKNPKGKEKQSTKNIKLINGVIAILIILPVCYLVYYVNIDKAGALNNSKEAISLKNTLPDSSLYKLQSAISLTKTTPNEANFISLSLEYYRNAKYTECADAANKALDYNAKSYAAYNNICSAYNQLGVWDKAIAAGKMALEIVPGDVLATNNLKVSTDGKAKQDKQIADEEILVKTTPSENNYMNLGNLYYMAQNYALAIKAYEKVVTFNSKNIAAFNNMCSASNELGNWKEAIAYCEKALKIDSTYTLAKNNLNIAKEKLR